MTPNRNRAWLLAAALAIANPFLHKPVSDVCDWAAERWGFGPHNRAALIAIPLLSVLIALAVLARRGTFPQRRMNVVVAIVLGAITLAAHRWLFVANIELIHFPQFALLGALLLAAGLGGTAAYLVTTGVGILDETYQHLVVYAGVPGTYFDVNDMVLNAIGAAWAVVLFGGVDGNRTRKSGVVPPWLVVSGVFSALGAALWLDPPRWSPLLQSVPSGRVYYRVLSTAEGIVACLVLWGLMIYLTRSSRSAAKPGGS